MREGIGPAAWAMACTAAVMAWGCGEDGSISDPSQPSRSVTQGGPQDIGELRAIVRQGQVPSLELLSEVGFFAEHAVDLPPADCDAAVCAHPMLAVAPRFDQGNWTMAYVALNSAVDPSVVQARPRHVILVVEHSVSTLPWYGAGPVSARHPAAILHGLLTADDRLSLVRAGAPARVVHVARADAPDGPWDAVADDEPQPQVADLYAALELAHELAVREGPEGLQPVVILVSSGRSGDLMQAGDFEPLAARFAEVEVPISSVGFGPYARATPELLADVTGGNVYYAEGNADLADVLAVEAATGFRPLARDMEIELTASEGYRIGRVYGARRMEKTERGAVLSSPILQLGARTGARDVESGRRGGGGGFFVELVSDVQPGGAEARETPVVEVSVRYEDALSGQDVELQRMLMTPLGPGQNPPIDDPFFSDRGKPFMMLNMYLAMRNAISLHEDGECGGAVGLRSMMQRAYDNWSLYVQEPDPDIDDDWMLLQELINAIQLDCAGPVYEPSYLPVTCFGL